MKRLFAIFVSAALLLSALTASAFADEQKVLHWYIEGEITTMDSGKTYDTLSGEAVAYFADSLYRLDQNAEPVPNLAAALPEISEDGLTVTVTIGDDAYYANGEKIVAANIEYAVQRVFDPAVGSQNTSIASIKNKDAVRASELGVKALSDTVIEFTLEAPDPYIVKKLADTAYTPVNRAFAEEKGDQYGLSADNLLASGPYSLADWSGADISWRYIKNPYQTNLPRLTINLANVPSSVRFEEMMSYQFDLALGGWTGDYDPTSYPNQFEASYAHNHGQWKAQELTDLINKLNQEDGTDFAARWTHLGEANSHLIDNVVVVPLEQEVKGYLVNPALKGYITHQLGSAAFDLTRAYFEE